MFEFEKIKNNKEEAIRLVNKILIDEINYINKLCFVYSFMKEKHSDIFSENLSKLLAQINKLKNLKDYFEDSIQDKSDIVLDEKVASLSEIKINAEEMFSEDIDEMIDLIVEESDVNGIGMENTIGYLVEIDENLFDSFVSNVRDINEETINYIVRSIKRINKKSNSGR